AAGGVGFAVAIAVELCAIVGVWIALCFCCNSPLSWPAWKEACATLQKLLSVHLFFEVGSRKGSSAGEGCHTAPHLLQTLLSYLAQAIADYVVFQVESRAHCIQIFDSWVDNYHLICGNTGQSLISKRNGGLLERMKDTGVDVIGLDWTVDIGRWKKKIGSSLTVK
ncbi:hypothetical protein S245_066690, partial [Arachis hypogaea]